MLGPLGATWKDLEKWKKRDELIREELGEDAYRRFRNDKIDGFSGLTPEEREYYEEYIKPQLEDDEGC